MIIIIIDMIFKIYYDEEENLFHLSQLFNMEDNEMKMAIAAEGQKVSPLIHRCKEFTIVEIVEGQMIEQKQVDSSVYSLDNLGQFLKSLGIDVIIAGSMENTLQKELEKFIFIVLPDIKGDVDEVIKSYMKGKLTSNAPSCGGCVSCGCKHKK